MDEERARPALAPTGDARVDEAIEGLADLDQIDLDERPAVLEEVHDRLREILGELGEAGRQGQAATGSAGPGAQARPGQPGRPGQQGVLPAGFAPRPGPPGSGRRPGA
jgi:hypothetical protein